MQGMSRIVSSQVLPFFSGERSPGYNDDARACILGLRRSTSRAHLVRAGIESVCLRLAAIIDLMCADDVRGDRQSHLIPRFPGEVDHSVSPESALQRANEQEIHPGTNDEVQSTAASLLTVSKADAREEDHRGEGEEEEKISPMVGVVRREAEVVTSGGAVTSSSLWKQILADALGRNVRDSGRTEETSFGIAVLLSSLESTVDAVGAIDGTSGLRHGGGADGRDEDKRDAITYTPNMDSFARYSAAKLAQERVYKALFGCPNVCPGVV